MMVSIKNKKVLVTGAGGFIGSHLTELLLKKSARVTALVRYTSSGRTGWLEHLPPSAQKKIKIIHGDIRDPDICQQAVRGNDYIFHLAAQIAIPYSYIAPRDFLAVKGGTDGKCEEVPASVHIRSLRDSSIYPDR